MRAIRQDHKDEFICLCSAFDSLLYRGSASLTPQRRNRHCLVPLADSSLARISHYRWDTYLRRCCCPADIRCSRRWHVVKTTRVCSTPVYFWSCFIFRARACVTLNCLRWTTWPRRIYAVPCHCDTSNDTRFVPVRQHCCCLD